MKLVGCNEEITLTIRIHVGLIAGASAPDADAEIVVPLEAGDVSARALIQVVVRHEVDAFRDRSAERTKLRVLTPTVLLDGLAAGVVLHGGNGETTGVDADTAVDVAMLAFTDGVFEMFVDGERVRDPDRSVAIDDGAHVSFLRLVPLIGF